MKISKDQLLSANKAEQDRAIGQLHRYCMPRIEKMMHGLDELSMEAMDIFQDSMAVLYVNLKNGRYNQSASLETYTLSICKNTWLYKLRGQQNANKRNSQYLELERLETAENIPDLSKITALLDKLKADCKRILILYYYEKKSMREIMEIFDFKNQQSAKNKKSRCLQKLTEIIRNAKISRDDFFDQNEQP